MNITIDINLKASKEVTNALLTLAAVLHNAVPIFDESEENTKIKEVEKPKEVEQSKEDIKTENKDVDKLRNHITLEEVREKLASLAHQGKQGQVKDLIKKFGGKKLTDISKDKYLELLKDAEMI